ncbi:MAG: hypothetical protein H6887_13485 [Hoeflea sp.]|nr:hypothetical protein [Hoeflea sp.]
MNESSASRERSGKSGAGQADEFWYHEVDVETLPAMYDACEVWCCRASAVSLRGDEGSL